VLVEDSPLAVDGKDLNLQVEVRLDIIFHPKYCILCVEIVRTIRERGLVHPKGENSMAVSELGCENLSV